MSHILLDIHQKLQQFKELVMEKEEPKLDFAKQGAQPEPSWAPGVATMEET